MTPQPQAPQRTPVQSLRCYEGSERFAVPGNAELCLAVRLALTQVCPSVAFAVDVIARSGVVHLSGSVPSERKLQQMYKAVRTVPGIRWVCNDVFVAHANLARAFDAEELALLELAA